MELTHKEIERLAALKLQVDPKEVEAFNSLDPEIAAACNLKAPRLAPPAEYIAVEVDADKPMMPASAMHGIAAEYAEAIQTVRDYAYLSLLIQYSPFVRIAKDSAGEPIHHRVNLFGILLGGSGTGKGASMNRAQRMLYGYRPSAISIGVPASGEGLIVKYKTDDIGLEPTYVCHTISEFRALVKKAGAEGSTLWERMNEFFEEDNVENSTVKETITANVRLSFIGGGTIDSLDDFGDLFSDDINTGQGTRTIYAWSDPLDIDDTWSRDLVDAPPPIGERPRTVKVTLDLLRWVKWWKDSWTLRLTLEQRATFKRLTQILHRVALVSAAINGESEVSWECFLAAAAFCDWQFAMRLRVVPSSAKNSAAKVSEAILRYTKAATKLHGDKDGWVSWREVKRAGGKTLTQYGNSELERQREALIREETLLCLESAQERKGNPPLKVKLNENWELN